MKKARKVVSVFLTVMLLALSCGCTAQVQVTSTPTETIQAQEETSTQPESAQTQEPSQSATSSDDRWAQMQAATLQYPSSNDEWEYNVYDCYVELTDYTGSAFEGTLVIPEEIDGLPVWSINTKGNGISNFLTDIELPKSLLYIGEGAFVSTSYLENINFPDGLKVIERQAFMHCLDLTEITIPASVEKIGYEAFWGCNFDGKTLSQKGLDVTMLSMNAELGDDFISRASRVSGYAGSTMAQYCAENGIDFQVIE